MLNGYRVPVIGLGLLFSACATIEPGSVAGEPVTYSYTEPRVSGLNASYPYPGPGDVCVSLNSNTLTKPFEEENHFLIACPKHEMGAIEDRMTQQNASVVGNGKHWVVMRVSVN